MTIWLKLKNIYDIQIIIEPIGIDQLQHRRICGHSIRIRTMGTSYLDADSNGKVAKCDSRHNKHRVWNGDSPTTSIFRRKIENNWPHNWNWQIDRLVWTHKYPVQKIDFYNFHLDSGENVVPKSTGQMASLPNITFNRRKRPRRTCRSVESTNEFTTRGSSQTCPFDGWNLLLWHDEQMNITEVLATN